MMQRVLDNISHDLDGGQGQRIYYVVNASPPKPLDIHLQTSQVHRSHDVEGTGQHITGL